MMFKITHVPLAPFDNPRTQRRSSKDDRIDPDAQYLAKIYGTWYLGSFSEQWYGWNFDNWGTSGMQLDSIEDLYVFAEYTPEQAELEKRRAQFCDMISGWSEDHYAAGWIIGVVGMVKKEGGLWAVLAEACGGWPIGYRGEDGWGFDTNVRSESDAEGR